MTEHLQIVIADDNYLVREGTRQLLEASGEVTVQAAVGSAPELLDAVRRRRPDAVLTDIRMPVPAAANGDQAPAMEGIDAAHAIKVSDPRVGVVILSQYADESYAFELFRNGTAGLAYLLKDRVGDLGQLLSALRAVAPAARSSTLRWSMPWSAGGPACSPRQWPGSALGSSTCYARWRRAAATRASPWRCTCRSPQSRSTSTQSSPSWTWLASSRCTGASRPCSRSCATRAGNRASRQAADEVADTLRAPGLLTR
jgi:CheY-like chemotaxis protein